MTTLKELKEQWKQRARVPAKKDCVVFVIEQLGGAANSCPSMRSIANWEWAVNFLLPEYEGFVNKGTVAILAEQVVALQEQVADLQNQLAEAQAVAIAPVSESAVTESLCVVESEPKSDEARIARACMMLPEALACQFLCAVFSNAEDIKKLYRALAMHLHPDMALDKAKAQKLFINLKDIYEHRLSQWQHRFEGQPQPVHVSEIDDRYDLF